MKRCIWCLMQEPKVPFNKKAHTIPKSLGGQNYNQNVCDVCNEYFGSRQYKYYSIEGALKETFNVTRFRLLHSSQTKKQVGEFKSVFFELKFKRNHFDVRVKDSFRFDSAFQTELCRAFKRGLYKLYFEELNRQKEIGFEDRFNFVRAFSRYDKFDLPVFYFVRSFGVILLKGSEAETPILYFDRMNYLYSNDFFAEIEFLGHVFGFPVAEYNQEELNRYIQNSTKLKGKFFKGYHEIKILTNIDLTLSVMDN